MHFSVVVEDGLADESELLVGLDHVRSLVAQHPDQVQRKHRLLLLNQSARSLHDDEHSRSANPSRAVHQQGRRFGEELGPGNEGKLKSAPFLEILSHGSFFNE